MKRMEKNILRRSFIGCTFNKRKFWVDPYSDEINLGSFLNANWQLKYILESKNYTSGWLLDIGCGKKPFLYVFNNVERYIGIDWLKSPHLNSEVDILSDARKLPFKDESFDTILCTEVIEHIYEFKTAISEMNRILKNGGVLILSTPYFYWVHESPYDFFRFTKNGIVKLMEENGFKIEHFYSRGGAFSVFIDMYGKVMDQIIEKLFHKVKEFRFLNYVRSFLCRLLIVMVQRLYSVITFAVHHRFPKLAEKLNIQDKITLGYFMINRKVV